MSDETVLAVNCGSSSIKFAGFTPGLERLFSGLIEEIGAGLTPRLRLSGTGEAIALPPEMTTHAELLPYVLDRYVLAQAGTVIAAGHRVVHGGERFVAPVLVDADSLKEIEGLVPLARSHQPHNAAGIRAAIEALPGVPQVACFDTAFHRTLTEMRQRYAIPDEWTELGIRRYGFHGLSYEWIASRLPEILDERAKGRVIICHLGNGASLAGLENGVSRVTSMGFTPLEGLMMGRRPGHLDPGVLLWLMEERGLAAATIGKALHNSAGLMGVSGISPDMRDLLASDAPAARLAVDMFVDRLVQEIGSAAAAIGGLDAIVFTGGIGEHAAPIRARTLEALAWLGIELDPSANEAHAVTITRPGSRISAHVVPTDEERVIARHALQLIGRTPR